MEINYYYNFYPGVHAWKFKHTNIQNFETIKDEHVKH